MAPAHFHRAQHDRQINTSSNATMNSPMISPVIINLHPELDRQQREVIAHGDGPLLVVAGPGSGKTASVALRSANLVLTGRAQPRALVLCTFTREAAQEMRRRFAATLRAAAYAGGISRVVICTIHSLCHRLLTQHGHAIGLAPDFRLLNMDEQLDMLETNHRSIFGPDLAALSRGDDRWVRPEEAAEAARIHFDRISDDLIHPDALIASGLPFQAALGRSYLRYGQLLWQRRAADFGHLQSWALALLANPQVRSIVSVGVRHLLVDEYQDTSFAQERLLLGIASAHRNICVVGDDDQAIYRFRGARVDNMLRFTGRHPDARVMYLTNNYRSHRDIVDAFGRWMAAADWSHSGGYRRFAKTITPRAAHAHDGHPAVVSIMGRDRRESASRLAEFLRTLRARGFIIDYGEVAILLHSVKRRHSRHYRDALDDAGIPVAPAPGRHGSNDEADDEVANDAVADDAVDRHQHHDRVLLTTIHQAKGREWPVVVVGLPSQFHARAGRVDQDLGMFRNQRDIEPPERADEFDLRRQYYVAFSRAKRLLALTGTNPDPVFTPVLSRAQAWPDVDLDSLGHVGYGLGSPRGVAGPAGSIVHVGPLGLEMSDGARARITLGGRVLPSGGQSGRPRRRLIRWPAGSMALSSLWITCLPSSSAAS